MRIIAGKWRGRRIDAPDDRRVRPTGDRVREAWMSIVQPWIPGARVLDLCAGSGALGLEALSRGAALVDFVDLSSKSLDAVRRNASRLGAGTEAVLHRADAARYAHALEAHAYDVAFADPPYDLGLAARLAEQWIAVPFADILGVEHRFNEPMPEGGERRKYGSTAITFYRV